MPTFLLIRHGESQAVAAGRMGGRLPGVHLTETGHTQAQAVAQKLAGAPVKALYCSPMERTLETAEPIARALGLAIIPREGLLEGDCGEWSGKTIKGLRRRKLWHLAQSSPSTFTFPGGESFVVMQQRIVAEIQTLAAQHAEQELVVCVSHADPIRLAVTHFIGLSLDNFQRLSISPASITALHIGEANCRLLTLNTGPALTFIKP